MRPETCPRCAGSEKWPVAAADLLIGTSIPADGSEAAARQPCAVAAGPSGQWGAGSRSPSVPPPPCPQSGSAAGSAVAAAGTAITGAHVDAQTDSASEKVSAISAMSPANARLRLCMSPIVTPRAVSRQGSQSVRGSARGETIRHPRTPRVEPDGLRDVIPDGRIGPAVLHIPCSPPLAVPRRPSVRSSGED